MPDPVETTDPEGVDFAWVMQTTFVLTILLGAPIVALASIPVSLPTWDARAGFAIRVGAIVWIVVACGAFLYERRRATGRAANEGARRKPADDGERDPKRGDGEHRTSGGRQDDSGARRDDDREDTRGDGSPPSTPQSPSSESRSET